MAGDSMWLFHVGTVAPRALPCRTRSEATFPVCEATASYCWSCLQCTNYSGLSIQGMGKRLTWQGALVPLPHVAMSASTEGSALTGPCGQSGVVDLEPRLISV